MATSNWIRVDPRDTHQRAFRPDPRNVGGRALIVDNHLSHRLLEERIKRGQERPRIDNTEPGRMPKGYNYNLMGNPFVNEYDFVVKTYNTVANIKPITDSREPQFYYKQKDLSVIRERNEQRRRDEHQRILAMSKLHIDEYRNQNHYADEPFRFNTRRPPLARAQNFCLPEFAERDPATTRAQLIRNGLSSAGSRNGSAAGSRLGSRQGSRCGSSMSSHDNRPSSAQPPQQPSQRPHSSRPSTKDGSRTRSPTQGDGDGASRPASRPSRPNSAKPRNIADPYKTFKMILVQDLIERNIVKDNDLNEFFEDAERNCSLPDRRQVQSIIQSLRNDFFMDL